jgi:hypothetical protein
MRRVGQNYRAGKILVEDTTTPTFKPNGIIVRTRYTVISLDTELMKIRQGKMSYLGRVLARIDSLCEHWRE